MQDLPEKDKLFLVKAVLSQMFSLKLNILKTRTMPSGSITSWQIDGETMKTVTYFISLGFKIIADDDCSHEIKKKICSLEEKLLQI